LAQKDDHLASEILSGMSVEKLGCFSNTETVKHTQLYSDFYPRDAMLARILAMALCLPVTSWCSIETAE